MAGRWRPDEMWPRAYSKWVRGASRAASVNAGSRRSGHVRLELC